MVVFFYSTVTTNVPCSAFNNATKLVAQ